MQPQKRIGSFSINEGNGGENVTYKMNSRFSKLCCVYSYLLKMANVGEFPRSWFLRSALRFKERKRNCRRLFMSSTKLAIRHFQTYCFFDVLLLCLKFPIEMMPDVVFQILHSFQGRAICNKMTAKLKPGQTNRLKLLVIFIVFTLIIIEIFDGF